MEFAYSVDDSTDFNPQPTTLWYVLLMIYRGCFYKDGIIKIFTEIHSDMHSSPVLDEQKLFMRQGMVFRGGNGDPSLSS